MVSVISNRRQIGPDDRTRLTMDRPVYRIQRMSTPAATLTPATPGTRERLIDAMQQALRLKGYHGVGLSELLSTANAPKGVLYHHFPGGKTELAVVAIEGVIGHILAGLDRVFERNMDLSVAMQGWMAGAQKTLAGSGYASGCPLAAVALESTPQDVAIRAALATGFAAIRQRLGAGMQAAGMEPNRASNLAALMVSAYEGALVQARVAGNVDAMRGTTEALMDLVRVSLPPTT